MLDASAINDVIRSCVGDKVEAAFLINSEGEIIASGYKDNASGPEEHDLFTVTVATAWKVYGKCDLNLNVEGIEERDSLEHLLLDFQSKKVSSMSVAKNCSVALVGMGEIEAGLLKLKTAALQRGINFLLTQDLSEP